MQGYLIIEQNRDRGEHSEEQKVGTEARNKDYKMFWLHRSCKISRIAINSGLLNVSFVY